MICLIDTQLRQLRTLQTNFNQQTFIHPILQLNLADPVTAQVEHWPEGGHQTQEHQIARGFDRPKVKSITQTAENQPLAVCQHGAYRFDRAVTWANSEGNN